MTRAEKPFAQDAVLHRYVADASQEHTRNVRSPKSLYMIEYAPELLDMIDVTIGHSVTKNEMKVVETFRKVTKGEDPLLSSKALEQVKKAIQDAV